MMRSRISFTSSPEMLMNGATLRRSRSCQASSPRICRLSEAGEPIESLWDPSGRNHSTITSMREHKGYLYLGGLENNRIGRIKLGRGNPDWVSWESYWGDLRR